MSPSALARAGVALALSAARAWADDVTVTASAPDRAPGSVAVTASEGRRVAGAGRDPLRAVESLPGVGRASFDGGRIVLWGAAASDSRVLVDGVEIPRLYHLGGFRTVIGGDLVGGLTLTPGGQGAAYGRGTGGVLVVRTAPLPRDGWHGSAQLDLLDTSVAASATLFGRRLSVHAAAREGHLDRVAGAVAPDEVADAVPFPRYSDRQAKLSLSLGEEETLDLVWLQARDALARAVDAASATTARRERREDGFDRVWLRYSRAYDDGGAVELTPFVGWDTRLGSSTRGLAGAGQQERSFRYGLRASSSLRVSSSVEARVGLDAQGTASRLSRYGSPTLPPREGDVAVFGQAPGADFAVDDWTTTIVDVAPYVEVEARVGQLTVTPGIRIDGYLVEGSRALPRAGDAPVAGLSEFTPVVAPRLAASWTAGPRVSFGVAAGLYHQPPDPLDLSPVFGAPALGVSRARHLALSSVAQLTPLVSLDVTVFHESQDRLAVRSRRASPLVGQALTQEGEGRAYGVQTLLRRARRRGVFGWLAHTATRSERRRVGDARYRLFDEDRAHVLAAVAGVERGRWSVGVRFRYTTGAPRTPVVGSFYETTTGQHQPVFGQLNSARLPDFQQLDLRVERAIIDGQLRAYVYADVLNVTFRQNVEEWVYSADYRRRGELHGMPLLAVVGARIER
ncbi:MAG: hypothetical protein IT374_01960 [Polyangiaceae bacterium]|nr:hypothetical protein [Polyangiaceae bacterium]